MTISRSELDRLREEYRNWWSATEGWTRLEGAQKADALITALEAENERLRQVCPVCGGRVVLDATCTQPWVHNPELRPTEGGDRD